MKNRNSISILGSIVMLAAMPSNASNLLSNGDFNSGNFSGWWSYTADASQSNVIDTAYTYDATANAALTSGSSTWREVIGQDPSIGANLPYNLSFVYSATGTPTWGSAGVTINYYDAGSTYLNYEWIPLYDQQPAPNSAGQWLSYSGNFTTPASTSYLEIQFNVWNWTTLHVDNVNLSLTNVPEPASGALLGVAGLACLLRQRRA